MATSNFYNKNASKVYAVLMDYEDNVFDKDGNETEEKIMVSCNEYDYNDLVCNLKYELSKNSDFQKDYGKIDNNRNFDGTIIGSLVKSKCFADCEIYICLTSVIRSGYYEGANLDWELNISVDGSEVDIIDYSDFQYNSFLNKGICTILANKTNKWIEKTKTKLISELETVYENWSTPLIKVATFSNGETIYKQAN